ncbi:MAG TPA: class I SAM-dependent methyltransferase [Burkholderiales bacterium]|nr:class I SAM-dependent methyltransferase [Burkholderiales bacterium]
MSNSRYLESCPIGCTATLVPSDIVLSEGALLVCQECGQLISQCGVERYRQSMQEFDDPRGTLPTIDSSERRSWQNRKQLGKILLLLEKPAQEISLLDVGCSSGAFLSTALVLGFRAQGVEPAAKAAQSAIQSGLRVHIGTLHEARFPAQHFDAVTLFEVIEHIKDPITLLNECRRIMRPGGVLMIGTGNTDSWTAAFMKSRWRYFHIEHHGGHVSFFNPYSLRLLAVRAGFTLEAVETRNVRFYEKGDVAPALYRTAKVVTELLNFPAQLFGKGQDMLAVLRPS